MSNDTLDEILPTPEELEVARRDRIYELVKECLCIIGAELRNSYAGNDPIQVNLAQPLGTIPRLTDDILREVGVRCQKRGWALTKNSTSPTRFGVTRLSAG